MRCSPEPLVKPPDSSAGDAAEVIAFLEQRAFGSDRPVRRIDTHAASIFLTRDRAWKLKRPIRFDYLDFSTPTLRRAALEAELRFNRRTAPDLYLAVHAITRAPDGHLALDGTGEAIDWLLEMRRFADDALLDERARRGTFEPELSLRLAECVARFHAEAPGVPDARGATRVAAVIDGNANCLASFSALFPAAAVAALLVEQRRHLDRCAAALDARALRGRVRHCHGDLHLANIAMIDGEPTPFDCLEFDTALATTDTLYDLAFLLMDLWHRGMRGAANRVFNRYLDLGDDEDGVGAMPLFLSLRATIRAHVVAARAERSGRETDKALASSYFVLAAQVLEPAPRWLVAIGGRSGTGKSTLAATLGSEVGAPPGARVLRSDVLRKNLAGLAPETPLPRARYTAESAAVVYQAMASRSIALLDQGVSVIADAAFLLASQRAGIAAAAHVRSERFLGLWLEAGETARLARVTRRGRDASDADASVARRQTLQPVGTIAGWHRVMAGRDAAAVAAAARMTLFKAVRARGGTGS